MILKLTFDKKLQFQVNSQTELLLKRALGESEVVKNIESKEEAGRELLVQEFSWDDQGFCVMSNFYSDIAVLLDDKFRLAHSLVDTGMEENKEQETIFRRAVWNYVQVQQHIFPHMVIPSSGKSICGM